MPLSKPQTTPQTMPKGMARAVPTPPWAVAAQAIIPPTATTQGTDRSIWPSRITTIMPVAMTPRNEATFSCCSR